MDVNDILNALNGLLDLGDTLDNSGGGVSALTNGQHTTREVCRMELGQFLLYVGDGGNEFTDGQAALVNLLLGDLYGQTPGWRMKEVASGFTEPDPADNITYTAFSTGDELLSRQNGTPTTQFTDLLITIYESFGTLMVAFNENVISRIRKERYVDGLKARRITSGYSTPAAAAFEVKKETEPAANAEDIDIDEYIWNEEKDE